MRIVTQTRFPKMNIPKLKRVAAYARVSSGKDAMLHSLSAQVSYYSELIQNHSGWQYVGVYADEALTGTKDNRENFQRLLADCRAGKVDMVITKSISRFARNTVTLLETVRELKNMGVDVLFLKEHIHSHVFQFTNGPQQRNGIASEAGDGLGNDHIHLAGSAIRQ